VAVCQELELQQVRHPALAPGAAGKVLPERLGIFGSELPVHELLDVFTEAVYPFTEAVHQFTPE
jgi:hypothetical protein